MPTARPSRRIQLLSLALALCAISLAGVYPARAALLGIGADYVLYDINTGNGTPTNPRTVGNKVNSIAISPSGTLYGVSQGFPTDVPAGGMLYTIDITFGTATYVATLDTFIITEGDIACDPTTGILYAVDGPGLLFKINTSNGMGTIVGNVGTNLDLSAMAFDSSGNLFIVNSFGPTLLRVNKANAAVISSTPMSPVNQQVGGLAFSPYNGTLYYADGTTSDLFSVNTINGFATQLGPIPVNGGIWGLAYALDPTSTRAASWGEVKALYR